MDNILEKNISELFGFSDMTDEEKSELLDDIGSIILESAVLRYVATGNENDVAALENFLEKHENDDALIENLLKEFPFFQEVLENEIVAFKEDAVEVLEN